MNAESSTQKVTGSAVVEKVRVSVNSTVVPSVTVLVVAATLTVSTGVDCDGPIRDNRGRFTICRATSHAYSRRLTLSARYP